MLLKLDTTKLPKYVEFENFQTLADWEVQRYYNSNSYFSIIVINFEVVKPDKISYNNESVYRFLTTSVVKFFSSKDSYSIDSEGSLIVLLSDSVYSSAVTFLKKLLPIMHEKFKDVLNIYAGIASCPESATNFKELMAIAKQNCVREKEEIYQRYNREEYLEKDWKNKINKSLTMIEQNLKKTLFEELNNMLSLISNYDVYLGEHSALVTQGSVFFAQEMGYEWREVEKIAIASLLHDIGYTAIPKRIFSKPSSLSQEEWSIIKLHPTIACDHILRDMPIFYEYFPLIQNHHEFIDGSGYPKAKKGDQIPTGAQIISIVDSFNAMMADRPYRKALELESILEVFIENAGIKWDTELVTIFTALIADEKTRNNFIIKNSLNLTKLIS